VAHPGGGSLLRRGLLQSGLGKNIPAARGGWEEEKLKRVGNAGKGKERNPSFPALPFSPSSAPAPVSFPGVYKQEPLQRRERRWLFAHCVQIELEIGNVGF